MSEPESTASTSAPERAGLVLITLILGAAVANLKVGEGRSLRPRR